MAVLSRPFFALAAIAALLAPSLAAPVETLQARQSDYFAVTGAAVGGVQPRLEIRDVEANREMFNLLLLAMKRFQDMDQDEKLSYYEIGGIHGQPLRDWDGASSSESGNKEVGYCPHGSNLFGPWHRPYLALIEQILSQKAVEVAEEFTDAATKDRYRELAEKLRLPYWDWAKKTSENERILPRFMSQETISITFPNGTEATVDNPISMYRFHPLKPEEILFPMDKTPTTIRNANFFTEPSQPDVQEDFLKNEMPFRKEQLYVILSQYQTYNQFSNWGSEWTGLGNLESIHDAVHGTFGIHSHMGLPSVAAFDPGFYFHHANVDRLLALFERLHPDTWVTPHAQSGAGTWTVTPGSVQDATSPLTPFHRNAQGDYHTSNTIRQFENFKYTYPELTDQPDNSTLIARINEMYEVPITETFGRKRQENLPVLAISAEEPRAYLCTIEAPRNIVGTYKVDLLLGDSADPSFVGGQTVMSAFPTDQKAKGSVVLTKSLAKKFNDGQLESLDKDHVVEYLKKNLHWRVEQGDQDVDTSAIKVTVASTEVKPAENESDFPVFVGGFEEHLEVPEA